MKIATNCFNCSNYAWQIGKWTKISKSEGNILKKAISSGDALLLTMDIIIASFDSISEVDMVQTIFRQKSSKNFPSGLHSDHVPAPVLEGRATLISKRRFFRDHIERRVCAVKFLHDNFTLMMFSQTYLGSGHIPGERQAFFSARSYRAEQNVEDQFRRKDRLWDEVVHKILLSFLTNKMLDLPRLYLAQWTCTTSRWTHRIVPSKLSHVSVRRHFLSSYEIQRWLHDIRSSDEMESAPCRTRSRRV